MIYECTIPFYCPIGAVLFTIGVILGAIIGVFMMSRLNIKRKVKK